MTKLDELLSAVFYRRSCPTAETLGAYYLGRLEAAERLEVALHMRECPHCARELAFFGADEERAEESHVGFFEAIGQKAAGWVARVIWATPAPGMLPALRGGGASPRRYAAEGTEVMLEVQSALSGFRRHRLVGRVSPAARVIGVELWAHSGLLDSMAVAPTGFFAFDRLKPGPYFLCVRRNGVETWLEVAV